MTARIVTPGNGAPLVVYRNACQHCTCVYDFTMNDPQYVQSAYPPYFCIACPSCNTYFSFAGVGQLTVSPNQVQP